MSSLRVSKVATPPTPAAGKIELFSDLNDLGRVKYIDEAGIVRILTATEWPRNILINGGLALAQRQAPGTLTTFSQTASRVYTADRWFASNENASGQYQRIDTISAPEAGVSARYYGKWKKITAAGKLCIGQVVESENMSHLRGKRVRLSFKMKRTVAAALTMRLGLAQLQATGTVDTVPGYALGVPSGTFTSAWNGNGTDPTLGANVARLVPVANTADGGTISGNGLSCVLSGNWVRYSACFDVPTDAKNLIVLLWSDSQMAANDEFNCSEVMLTEGPEVPDWSSLPFESELDFARRYFHKSFSVDIAPAQNVGLAGAVRGVLTAAGAVVSPAVPVRYPALMRSVPAGVFYNPSAANAFVRNTTLGTDATATSLIEGGDSGMTVQATGLAAWVVGNALAVHFALDAEL